MKMISKNLKIKIFITGIILLLMGCGTLYWYFGYYVKTPEYTLQMTEKAIKNHNEEKFAEYVDKKALIDQLSSDVVNNLINSNQETPNGMPATMQEYSGIFKEAFTKELSDALDFYVKNGKWQNNAKQQNESITQYNALLENLGLNNLTVKDYKMISVDKKAGKAVFQINVVQNELKKAFPFKIILLRQLDGHWKIVRIANFSDFFVMLNQDRRQYMYLYVNKTDSLMNQHRETFISIQDQIQSIIRSGNIGSDEVRNKLKVIINTNMIPHWQMLKTALSAINAPQSAVTLQKLRLRVCDAYIAYYQNYAKWLDDKNINSLHAANDNLKKAKILEDNERNLTNIIKRNLTQ
ncbi:DUF2939 domain-containing protein [Pectinatus sottacetonis]|uniref:DUF2939 domain-containing protein n=1 Tax=Pectinatus sottacetonis TaxID=1002795 RepID=UPI0018C4AC43|nr:DUF2939 domain-containing protein [Pectinatus sottacetonis]